MTITTFKISIFLTAVLILSLPQTGSAQATPGDLDQTFGNGGKLVMPVAGWLFVNRTLLQPDGKFLTIGYDDGSSERFSFRHNANGVVDTAFSMGAPPSNMDFFDFAVQSDLKIIAVRNEPYRVNGTDRSAFGLYRFNSDGTIDTGFGANGVVTTLIANNSLPQHVAIQTDGKIVIAGIATENLSPYPIPGSNYKIALARYHPNGMPDSTFGTGGNVISDSGGCRLYLQPDDKLLCRNYEVVNRYNLNGTPDIDFGINGNIYIGGNSGGMAVQTDGSILISISDNTQTTINRYTPSGARDSTFGTNGYISVPHAAGALAVQRNAKILAAGNLNGNFIISRYTQNGTIDTTFGTNGRVVTTFANATGSRINELILQPDNKIVASLSVEFGSYYDSSPSIVRYLNDPIAAFAAISGKVLTPDGRGLRDAVVSITDINGVGRNVTTSSLGYYIFEDVALDREYTVSVKSKRYRFTSRNVMVQNELTSLNFIGLE